jgi:hypothetical protein
MILELIDDLIQESDKYGKIKDRVASGIGGWAYGTYKGKQRLDDTSKGKKKSIPPVEIAKRSAAMVGSGRAGFWSGAALGTAGGAAVGGLPGAAIGGVVGGNIGGVSSRILAFELAKKRQAARKFKHLDNG